MNIKELLKYGKDNLTNKEEAYRLAKMLLKYMLNCNDSYLILNMNLELDNRLINDYKLNIEKISSGIPIQYIIGNQEFMKLNFFVNEDVLIPQPDTEILVQEVINILKKMEIFKSININENIQFCYYNNKNKKVLDLCTGSGIIGTSIAYYCKNVDVTMLDISEKALLIAQKNIIKNNVENNCKVILSNLFENVKDKFDIIVSNPPYIKTDVIDTLSDEVKREPILALDGGEDGLMFYRKIAKDAYKYLNKDGILALEIGYDQKNDVISILQEEYRYSNIYCKKDLDNNDRIIVCSLK